MKRKTTLIILGIMIFIVVIIGISYAYFASNISTENNKIFYNTSFDEPYYLTVSLANTANNTATFGLSGEDMLWHENDVVASTDTNTFTFNLTNNSSQKIECTYDYVWSWTTGNGFNNYTISSGATKEFTVSGSFNETQVPNYNALSFVIASGTISANAGNTTTRNENITTKFYNLVNVDQTTHKGKKYKGNLTVSNAECHVGQLTLAEYIINNAPKSGTDAVSNSPWVLTSDREGEWRYAGKNPDNYILFNNELWRIIGVMPNMEYCTGTYTDSTCSETATGSLVKIVRNDSEGANAWDARYIANVTNNSIRLMSNPSNDIAGEIISADIYKNNWYTASLKTLINNYSYASNNNVAIVNWSLYGTTNSSSSVAGFYDIERNISNSGATYSNNPTYWYGKVGLIYPSDYGYATNGNGEPSGTYSRGGCLNYALSSWNNGNYKTYCATNDWLSYIGVTNTQSSTKYSTWTITQYSGTDNEVYYIDSEGRSAISYAVDNAGRYVHSRSVLYLKADTLYGGTGTGTWNNPYEIK